MLKVIKPTFLIIFTAAGDRKADFFNSKISHFFIYEAQNGIFHDANFPKLSMVFFPKWTEKGLSAQK